DVLAHLDPATFDWPTFLASYTGRALIIRLLHVVNFTLSSPSPSPSSVALAQTALRRLVPLIKQTFDHNAYLYVMNALATINSRNRQSIEDDSVSGSSSRRGGELDGVPDWDWVEEVKREERKQKGQLEVELQGYISTLIRESIRLSHIALARLASKRGDALSAVNHFIDGREYATGPMQHLEHALGSLEICLIFNQPLSLPGHISKLEATLDRALPASVARTIEAAHTTALDIRETREREQRNATLRQSVSLKLRIARTLVALDNQDYHFAGRQCCDIIDDGGLGEYEGHAISSSDVSLIGALCILATGRREEMRTKVLDNMAFRATVDDGSAWVIDLVTAFVDARYADVEVLMKKNEWMILLNPFLSPHSKKIQGLVRTKALVQYTEPFSSVSVHMMSQALGVKAELLLEDLEKLVEEGRINGKIDLIDGVLQMKQPDPGHELRMNAIKLGTATNEATRYAILRLKL
ncbi:hypothetical protein TREMEDRAFT_14118, partial [Tremella mesenterica DSM 1558]|uniref:uncharacterized protein n=1 Tax=Tremella mesenterica (strain ATCC 24925 / CBS 8224 / DSM 1558 / NBRC 9311 / NRRL Y-6157 / RJB 2259-6 / UBC 559-6) TaxID=578456 RepID=UPI0003F4A017